MRRFNGLIAGKSIGHGIALVHCLPYLLDIGLQTLDSCRQIIDCVHLYALVGIFRVFLGRSAKRACGWQTTRILQILGKDLLQIDDSLFMLFNEIGDILDVSADGGARNIGGGADAVGDLNYALVAAEVSRDIRDQQRP